MTDFRVTFHVPGEAVGKMRSGSGPFSKGRFTPKKTNVYEMLIKKAAADAMDGFEPFDGPVKVSVLIDVLVPKSWPDWKRVAALSGHVCATGKPDIDNTVKSIFDGMNTVVWLDDAQVCEASISKRYHTVAGVTVKVVSLPAAPQSITRKADLEAI